MKLKKLLSFLLSVMLILSVVPMGLFSITASAATTSGQCGANVYWSITNDTLTISGSGRMYAYSSSNEAPWGDYTLRKTYSKVVISSGITNIGAYAFYFCKNIRSISIPNSITSLGENAFSHCEGLFSISLPYGIKTIPNFCFSDCIAMENIVIPDTVTSFGQGSFKSSGIIEFTIPNGTTQISHSMFWGCSQLEKVIIPKSVVEIDTFAFHDCGNLTDVYYDGTVSDYKKIKIDSLAKYNEGLLNATFHYKCDENSHIYDNTCDDTCNLCGHKRSITHTYDNACDTTCNVCGYKRLTNHVYDNSCDEICNICGYKRSIKHSYKSTWENDFELHWRECSVCGEKTNIAAHDFKKKLSTDGLKNILVCSICKLEIPDKELCRNSAIAPIVTEITASSITLMKLEEYEYSIDGKVYNGNSTFTGLKENTQYTVYQRIKETDTRLPSKPNSSVIKTAKISVSSKTNFDKLKSHIITYGEKDSKGYSTVIQVKKSGEYTFYYAMQVKDSGIYFVVTDDSTSSSYVGSVTEFTLYKNAKDISVELTNVYYYNGKVLDALNGVKTINRSTYSPNINYTLSNSSKYLSSKTFSENFNISLSSLCKVWDNYIFSKLGFGLKQLGFLNYPGNDNAVCDPASGYHTGSTEIRYKRNVTCTIDGYTGDTFCTDCGERIKSGSLIPCVGKHTYDSQCDESCNVCGYLRDGDHTYSGACDTDCNICGHKRKTLIEHTYDDDEDLTCNVCGYERPPYTPGDLDGDEAITDNDVLYLLKHTFRPEKYPVNQPCDYNGDGEINDADAVYLLKHIFRPEKYPLTK